MGSWRTRGSCHRPDLGESAHGPREPSDCDRLADQDARVSPPLKTLTTGQRRGCNHEGHEEHEDGIQRAFKSYDLLCHRCTTSPRAKTAQIGLERCVAHKLSRNGISPCNCSLDSLSRPSQYHVFVKTVESPRARRARRQKSHPFSVPSVRRCFFSSAHALSARGPQKPVFHSRHTGFQEVL